MSNKEYRELRQPEYVRNLGLRAVVFNETDYALIDPQDTRKVTKSNIVDLARTAYQMNKDLEGERAISNN